MCSLWKLYVICIFYTDISMKNWDVIWSYKQGTDLTSVQKNHPEKSMTRPSCWRRTYTCRLYSSPTSKRKRKKKNSTWHKGIVRGSKVTQCTNITVYFGGLPFVYKRLNEKNWGFVKVFVAQWKRNKVLNITNFYIFLKIITYGK